MYVVYTVCVHMMCGVWYVLYMCVVWCVLLRSVCLCVSVVEVGIVFRSN